MTRIASLAMHRSLFDAIARAQKGIAQSQQQLATGKKASELSALGSEAARTLSSHAMRSRQQGYKDVASQLQSTCSLIDLHVDTIEQAATSLRTQLLKAVGTQDSTGLQGGIEEAFARVRDALNADEAGVPLFAGGQSQHKPYAPATLADTALIPAANAFRNGPVIATARVADGTDIAYGLLADDIASNVNDAFATLAASGPIAGKPTAAQLTAMTAAIDQLDRGLVTVREAQAENGRRWAQAETLGTRADDRMLILDRIISDQEDANMAEVASQLTERQSILEASYTVHARLARLSLVNYLD